MGEKTVQIEFGATFSVFTLSGKERLHFCFKTQEVIFLFSKNKSLGVGFSIFFVLFFEGTFLKNLDPPTDPLRNLLIKQNTHIANKMQNHRDNLQKQKIKKSLL